MLASDIKDVRAKPFAAGVLVAAAVFEGDMVEARARMKDLLRIFPKANASYARAIRVEYKNQDFVEKYVIEVPLDL